MTNIAEILKNAPQGLKLYSLVHGEVTLKDVNIEDEDNYPIEIIDNIRNDFETLTKDGKIYLESVDAECILFPSKEHKSWDNWQNVLFKVGDIVTRVIDEIPTSFIITSINKKDDKLEVIDKTGSTKTLNYICITEYSTTEECDQFFKELNANGYKWNADTKVFAEIKCPNSEIKCPNSEYNTNIDNQVKNNTFYHIPQETEVEVTPDGCYKCVLKTEKKNPKFRIGDHIVGDDETIYKIMDAHGTFYTLYDYSNQIEFKQTIKKIDENCSLVTNKELIDAGIKEKQFTVNSLKPFDKVLVRNYDDTKWVIDLFAFYDYSDRTYIVAGGFKCRYCIPYNDETKHLLGTTDDCPDKYKTW